MKAALQQLKEGAQGKDAAENLQLLQERNRLLSQQMEELEQLHQANLDDMQAKLDQEAKRGGDSEQRKADKRRITKLSRMNQDLSVMLQVRRDCCSAVAVPWPSRDCTSAVAAVVL